MRQSIRSLKRSSTYEIKQMTEKSNFSINDQPEEKPQNINTKNNNNKMKSNKVQQEVIKQRDTKKVDTSLGQRGNGDQQVNGSGQQFDGKGKKSTTGVSSYYSSKNSTDSNNININNNNNNKLSQTIQKHNTNNKATSYTYAFYFILLIYLFYTHLVLLPSMSGNDNINDVTAVVLAIGLLIDLVLIIVCYQQARRCSPGYPCTVEDLLRVVRGEGQGNGQGQGQGKVQGNVQGQGKVQGEIEGGPGHNDNDANGERNESEATTTQQQQQHLNDIKNTTIQLLIQKAQLKQAYEKDPTQQNLLKLQQFEYKFFVDSIKYCQKCNNIKLPRVRHCTECNRCVQRMDHHCVWLNNCVGRGNHKLFMLFLVFLLLGLTFYVVVGVVDVVVSAGGQEGSICEYMQEDYGSLMKILHILLILFAGVLWFYYVFVFFEQLYLIANNLTFVESLSKVLLQKKPWKKQSICENFQQVFGRGCWLCPFGVNERYSENEQIGGQKKQNKQKTPSVELVQEVIQQNKIHNNNLASCQSENQLRHERNQI